jgi:hypothetical protein
VVRGGCTTHAAPTIFCFKNTDVKLAGLGSFFYVMEGSGVSRIVNRNKLKKNIKM